MIIVAIKHQLSIVTFPPFHFRFSFLGHTKSSTMFYCVFA
jgi:hypothetical protein